MSENAVIEKARSIIHDGNQRMIETLIRAYEIFSEEPNYIQIDKEPTVWAGDTHADFDAARQVMKYIDRYKLIFLGDYIDRSESKYGSIINLLYLFGKKIINKDRIIMLRGNHEEMLSGFHAACRGNIYLEFAIMMGSGMDSKVIRTDDELRTVFDLIGEVFSVMPYVVQTSNGIIGLHGGLPDIKRKETLAEIQKGVKDLRQNRYVSQILWNDHDPSISDIAVSNRGSSGFEERLMFRYGRNYFERIMNIVGANVLLRGHDYDEKGYAFDDRLLTIFTSKNYADKGRIKGRYVAIDDNPGRTVRTAKDLRLEFI